MYQAHPYHLVQPSPWPIIISFTLLLFATNLIIYIHGYTTLNILIFSIIIVLLSIYLWLRDVAAEGTFLGDHTFLVQKGLSLGFWLFVTSEVIVFFGVFWAYFHSVLSPTVELGVHWPPIGIEALSPFEIPLFNTFILLSSGATITYAHHALISNKRNSALVGTILTIVLAVLFTFIQVIEYYNAPFTLADSIYGSVFFASTGIHSLHVIVGNIIIIVSLWRILRYHLTDTHHLGFESSILYWHFVDVVWLFLYVSVYYWGS